MNHLLLKATRELLRLSLSDMAKRTRIAFSTYRDIESGQVKPTRIQLERIQDIFDRLRARDQRKLATWNAKVSEKGGGE